MNGMKKAMIVCMCALLTTNMSHASENIMARQADATGIAYNTGRVVSYNNGVSTNGVFRNDLAELVIADVNAERAKYGLGQLRVDSELSRAAAVRAQEIVRKFSHTRPDGTKWSTVSKSAYGENIAKGQKTAYKVMAAWLTSSGHRANIMKASFGSIGVASYVHNGVTYWVQLFGK